MAMPVVPPPTPMPVPMAPVPMPVPVVPVPVMAPTHLLRLEMIDIVLCSDCGFYAHVARGRELLLWQSWRQRRGIRGCGKGCRARDRAKSKHQKMTAFHDVSPIHEFPSPESFAAPT
jgi:hypothetical protein